MSARSVRGRVIARGLSSQSSGRLTARIDALDRWSGGKRGIILARAFWQRKKRNRDASRDGSPASETRKKESALTEDGQADAAIDREHGSRAQAGGVQIEASSDDPADRLPIVVALTVQEGDTIDSLADNIGIPVDSLILANGGEREVAPGDQLTWRLPIPDDPKQLLQLMGTTGEGGYQQAQPSNPVLSTLRQLPPFAVFGAAAVVLLGLWRAGQVMSQREAAALRQRAAMNRKRRGTETNASNPIASQAPEAEMPREGTPAAADESDSPQAEEHEEGLETLSSAARRVANEPDWVRLPLVHFMQLPGNQFPSFLLQPQVPEEYSWLAFQERRDAEALQQWFVSNGKATVQSRVSSMFPLAFLSLAKAQSRGVSFVPSGSLKIRPELSEEDLWVEIIGAGQHLPLISTAAQSASVTAVVDGIGDQDSKAALHVEPPRASVGSTEPARSSGDSSASQTDDVQGVQDPSESSQPPAPPGNASGTAPNSGGRDSGLDNAATAEAKGDPPPQSSSREPKAEEGSSGSTSESSRQSEQEEAEVEDSEEQYAAMAEAMMVISESAQPPKGYVPKMARNFVEGFTRREQEFQAAAAADPDFKPLEVAKQLEEEEIAAILDPKSRRPTAEDLDDRSLVYGTLGENPGAPTSSSGAGGEASSPDATAAAGGVDKDELDFRARLRSLWDEASRRALEEEGAESSRSPSQPANNTATARSGDQAPGNAAWDQASSRSQKPGEVWWRKLAAIYLLEADAPEGGVALLSVDIALKEEPANVQVIGFADSQDAVKFMGLYMSHGLGECSVVIRTPGQLLADGIGGSASGLTVYRRRQLPLSPSLSERELTNLLISHAR